MAFFTLQRVASLQMGFTITSFVAFCYMIALKVFKKHIDCELADPGQKKEMEESCLYPLSFNNSSDALEISHYDSSSKLIWLVLLSSAVLNGYLWVVFQATRYRNPVNAIRWTDYSKFALNKSGFTCGATLGFLLASLVYQILAFIFFQLLDSRFVGFAVVWLANVYDGKPFLARQLTCEIRRYPVAKPTTTTTAICKLPMNSDFEFVYVVLWLWLVLLAVVNLLMLLRCLVFAFSSTLRLRRLSALLEGVDQQKISDLAKDVDAFFKIDCCACERVKLKGQQLLDVAIARRGSPSELSMVAKS